MFIDTQTQLSDAQAITADGYSTNAIDLGNVTPKRNLGDGEPLVAVFIVDVALAGTTPTIIFNVVQSANANLSSHTVLCASQSYSSLAAGAQVVVPIPQGAVTAQYIGAYYDVGGTSPTITVTGMVVPQSFVPRIQSYADALTIS